MHKDFADWYRACSLQPSANELRARWSGIEKFANDSVSSDIADMTRLLYGFHIAQETFINRFREAFKTADESFPMRDNDAELRVLAGATLVKHFDFATFGPACALALNCASYAGIRRPPVEDFLEQARSYLYNKSASLRQQSPLKRPNEETLTGVVEDLKSACQSNELTKLAEPLLKALRSIEGKLNELITYSDSLRIEQELRREESDVLWWLVGGHSRDLKLPFSDMKHPASCLIVGKELADLARLLPGPFAAEAFLSAVLAAAQIDSATAVSLAEAVTTTPAEWRPTLSNALGIELVSDLCPVHLALRKYVEADGRKTWQTLFHTATSLKASEVLMPSSLALQVYHERLFLRSLSELSENHHG